MEYSKLLDKWSLPQKVGTDGFVKLVDVMGNDDSIVQAARVSYGKGTKTVLEDRGLIRYLTRHWHSTPSEMCEIKLHIRIPNDAWKQMLRHRTANINEYSTRYSEAIDAQNTTAPYEWRLQSINNKQGSAGALYEEDLSLAEHLTEQEQEFYNRAKDLYEEMLKAGIAREQARKVLPFSTYTEAYWKVDLHNLFHFLRLRLDSHAQQEIREFAQAITNIVKDWVPLAYEAFVDYRLEAVQFSKQEMEVLRFWMEASEVWGNEFNEDDDGCYNLSNLPLEHRKKWLSPIESQRERIEFWKKINS